MAILSKGTDFTTGDQVTAANLDALVDSATFASGAVDNTTTILDSNSPQRIIVKNEGIGTTQLADDAVTAAKIAAGALTDVVYPVGSIFTTVTNYADSAAVVTAIGGTTWTAFGAGRVLVGLDSSDTDFDAAEETGGAKTVTLTSAQSGVPAHAHKFRLTSDSTVDSGDTGAIVVSGGGSTVNGVTGDPSNTAGEQIGGNTAADAASAHTNLQPYIVVYMWKRTA
jgi:microcystin-dependent protein